MPPVMSPPDRKQAPIWTSVFMVGAQRLKVLVVCMVWLPNWLLIPNLSEKSVLGNVA